MTTPVANSWWLLNMETFTTLLPLCGEFTGHQWIPLTTLHWRHNDHDSVSNHQPHGCLLNRLFRSRSKKTSKLRVTGLCVGNSPGPVNSPHKGPVTRKMFSFDDVIMKSIMWILHYNKANILFPKKLYFFLNFSSRQWQLMVDIDERSMCDECVYYDKHISNNRANRKRNFSR